MWVPTVLLAGGVLIWLLLLGMKRVYRNPKTRSQKTPGESNISYQEISIPARNECRLYGWWIPARDGDIRAHPTVVLVHGWGRNVERMLPYIRALHPENYNMVAFDSRNHGRSDEDEYSSMVKFAEDISSTIDFVVSEKGPNPDQIGVIGLSIGGAAAIYAAAHDPRIRCVITAGAFAHPADIMRQEFRTRHIPYFPLAWLLFRYVQWRIGKTFSEIAPETNISRSTAKFFLIHGQNDRVVPLEQGLRLQQAGNPAQLEFWIVPGKGHSDCHDHPDFWPRVKRFLHQAFRQ